MSKIKVFYKLEDPNGYFIKVPLKVVKDLDYKNITATSKIGSGFVFLHEGVDADMFFESIKEFRNEIEIRNQYSDIPRRIRKHKAFRPGLFESELKRYANR